MGTRTRVIRESAIVRTVLLPLFVLALLVTAAFAGDQDRDRTQDRDRIEARDDAGTPQGDQLRDRIRDRINDETGLQQQDRDRLRENLAECDQLGLDDDAVATLFSDKQPLQKQIRTQERVLAMAREGLPTDPVTRKLQEGYRKGAGEPALEKVCEQMEANVRAAHQFMVRAREDGVTPGKSDVERRQVEQTAMAMWRGLDQGDLDQLRERAKLRLRDGSCSTDELTTAAATAANLKELGVERHRAVRLSGEALQNGYTANEMRQLRWMVMTARMNGGSDDDVLNAVENGIRNQRQLTEMVNMMWQRGWMGPADEHGGHGGQHMGDDTGGGPGGQGSGQGGHQGGSGGHHGGNNNGN